MRVLMATFWDYPHIGGVSTHITELKDGLEMLGHSVDIFSMNEVRNNLTNHEEKLKIKMATIQKDNSLTPFIKNYEINKLAYALVAEEISFESYDIIHAHDVVSALVLGSVINSQIVLTIHGYLTYESITLGLITKGSPEEKYLMDIERNGLYYAKEIITPALNNKQYILSTFNYSNKISVINNFVKVDETETIDKSNELRNELNIPLNSIIIVSPNRLVKRKGVIYGVEAMVEIIKKIPSAYLLLFGSGPLHGEILNYINNNNLLLHCILGGDLPNHLVRKYIQASDFVLVPSIPIEGEEEATSLSAIEGMAAGKVVVASSSGGLKELIKHNDTGILVPPSDSNAIAQAIIRLSKDKEQREKIGLNARENIIKNHSHISAAKKVEEVYRRNLNNRSKVQISLRKESDINLPELSHLINSLRQREFQQRLKGRTEADRQSINSINQKKESLHVVYVMTHVGVTGGSKIIFQHANYLNKAGVKVTIVSHFPKPDWYPVDADYIQVPFGVELAKGIPNCDVIVATYWDHIQTCVETGIAPVIYFEQGDFHLYDLKKMNSEIMDFIRRQYEIPEFILTVSNQTAKVIKKVYNREAKVIHNALDLNIFTNEGEKYNHPRPYILMIGSDQTKFKRIEDIINAYEILKSQISNIDLIWITPNEPSTENKKRVSKVFINPTQKEIAKFYRGALAYVSGSQYESFPLPPLEAMSCGTPVITTDNIGVLEYAIDSYNALIVPVGDIQKFVEKIIIVYQDRDLRQKLIENGLKTSKQFTWENIIIELKKYFTEITNYAVMPRNQLKDWEIKLTEDQFNNQDDYEKFLRFLKNTVATEVYVVVVYSLIEGHQTSRWELAAKKKDNREVIIDKCYVKVNGKKPHILPYQDAYQLFVQKKYAGAYDLFKRKYEEQHGSFEKS
ncbi:MAG TPA: glycosyltransferase family 4 protein, partial [Bacillales bacterium]|nr:glycosyltransferase family 4 protein [Bacillales bacterium]